ncbi:substrate-binding domain-containing protein [Lachnoclostridium sp. Marseille-P6806]|uniref:substrate-binding domain-containing protein n=1 Tax=Lachnoclostridium sp. Marseille-P6806 TaxID=2364793 RepID=UPI00102F4324|nr:substrate-binding domain-containing protein [Lachnoclostridium sp. Marseille-P6806]
MRKFMTGKMGKGMTAAAVTLVSSAMLLAGCGGTQPETAAPQESASNEAASQESAAEMPAELSGNIAVNGSTSMEKVIGLLSEQFMMENSGVTITYDATGSGTGIEAAGNGTCDIGLASRDLKEEEKSKGLAQTTIAKDGIAIIVNEANPLEDLSVEQIADVYTGSITSWSELSLATRRRRSSTT